MADKSKIPYCDATWSPIAGCTKQSPGCRNCFALRNAHRMAANPNPKLHRRYAGTTHMTGHGLEWTGHVNLCRELLDVPAQWKRPRRIFVGAMSDLFQPAVPHAFLDCVFEMMKREPRHTFLLLTKHAQRMADYMALYDVEDAPHIWPGVSVETQRYAEERIPELLRIKAAMHWVSVEPLLGPVDLSGWMWGRAEPCEVCPKDEDCDCGYQTRRSLGEPTIDSIVVGGETGWPDHARRMNPLWVQAIRDTCVYSQTPFWFKSWGAWAPAVQFEFGDLQKERTCQDDTGLLYVYGSPTEWGNKLDSVTGENFPEPQKGGC